MFYQNALDEQLRFGDVVTGFPISTPTVDSPPLKHGKLDYTVEIDLPSYSVVISPCCSIENKMISLSPLIRVQANFFSNPEFVKDLTIINRRINAEKTVPPPHWEKMTETEKMAIRERGEVYALINYFIYAPHDLFSEYDLKVKDQTLPVKYYMIDFRSTSRANCAQIVRQKTPPTGIKSLQLTVQTRKELREKVAAFYGRPAEEDMAVLLAS